MNNHITIWHETFDSESDAIKERKILSIGFTETNIAFCPLINSDCRDDCQCHVSGKLSVHQHGKSAFVKHTEHNKFYVKIEQAHCENAMFIKTITGN